MKQARTCLLILFLASLSYSQFYPFARLSFQQSCAGFGVRFGQFSPYVGIGWQSIVERTYDSTNTSLLDKGSSFYIAPSLGMDFLLSTADLAPYITSSVGFTKWIRDDWYLGSVTASLGIGLEARVVAALALSAQYSACYVLDKYRLDGGRFHYLHYFAGDPAISVKYYVRSRKLGSQ
jgi:hypothetical protein